MTQSWTAHTRATGWTCAAPAAEAMEFHKNLPEYAATPLLDISALTAELGVGRVFAKDESNRLGLPAFKALGASWAIHRAVSARNSSEPLTIVTATDGNHGRAVAKFSKTLGHRARIYTPAGVHPSAIQAIRDEGATVIELSGDYDNAVATAAASIDPATDVLVQDTSWPGYEEIPQWIVEGYATLFAEADEQLRESGLSPDVVLVPTGVGSLLQAALAHYRSRYDGPAVVSVEPEAAACIPASLLAGEPVTVETGITVMAGLNCGTPSALAWPYIANGLDGAVVISDAQDITAGHDLAAAGIPVGPCGASGLASLRVLSENSDAVAHLGLGPDSVVLLIITEGSDANPLPTV